MGFRSESHGIMQRSRFGTEKIRKSLIWAAKWKVCPKCGASRGKPCENLNKRNQGKTEFTVNPHDERIDWELLLTNLKARGYK